MLIVDDLVENLDLLSSIIQHKNLKANVIRARAGQQAIERIHDIDLALAILDARMAGMDGYELALMINEARHNDKVPIIFMTANYISEAEIIKGYNSGAVDYIVKPFIDSFLVSKINIFLDLFNYKLEIIRDAA